MASAAHATTQADGALATAPISRMAGPSPIAACAPRPSSQPAGQVGQEIYGCGAAFVFVSRAFHSVQDAPFRIFCDHFLLASHRPSATALSFELGGCEGNEAMLAFIRCGRQALPAFTVQDGNGSIIRSRLRSKERVEYRVPANGGITIQWR